MVRRPAWRTYVPAGARGEREEFDGAVLDGVDDGERADDGNGDGAEFDGVVLDGGDVVVLDGVDDGERARGSTVKILGDLGEIWPRG
jgi:hypothetical protein